MSARTHIELKLPQHGLEITWCARKKSPTLQVVPEVEYKKADCRVCHRAFLSENGDLIKQVRYYYERVQQLEAKAISESPSNRSFMEQVTAGDVPFNRIDEFVSAWHETSGPLELDEFLGMTSDEYRLWVENPRSWRFIVSERLCAAASEAGSGFPDAKDQGAKQ